MKSKNKSPHRLVVKINGEKNNCVFQPLDDKLLDTIQKQAENNNDPEFKDATSYKSPSKSLDEQYRAAMLDAEQTLIKLEQPSPTKETAPNDDNNNILGAQSEGDTCSPTRSTKRKSPKSKSPKVSPRKSITTSLPNLVAQAEESLTAFESPSKRRRVTIKEDEDAEDCVEEPGKLVVSLEEGSDCESRGSEDCNGEMEDGGVVCEDCGFVSPNRGELHKHMRKHTPDKPYGCPVAGCDFRTRYPGNIKHHLPSHKEDRPFGCDQCELKFKTKSQLSTHMLVHNSTKPFSCEVCGFRCKRRWELKMHKLSHSDARFFKCDTCGHETKTMSDLVKHQAKHTEERNFQCTLCEKAYKDNRALRKHIRYTHTEAPPVTCSVCQKMFRNKINLRNHMRLHEGHYPFKCDVCSMRFANSHNKRVHMEVHEGDRPFKCPVCPYAGKQELDVRAHIGVMHKNDKLYRCNACDVGFSKERGLIQHFNTDKHKVRIKRDAEKVPEEPREEVILSDQGTTISVLSNGNIVLSQVKQEPLEEGEELPTETGEAEEAKASTDVRNPHGRPVSESSASKASPILAKTLLLPAPSMMSPGTTTVVNYPNFAFSTVAPAGKADAPPTNPITVLVNQTAAGLVVAARPTLGTLVLSSNGKTSGAKSGTAASQTVQPTVIEPTVAIKEDPDAQDVENNNSIKIQSADMSSITDVQTEPEDLSLKIKTEPVWE